MNVPTWDGSPQPLDLAKVGDRLPDGVHNHGGSVNGAKLLRALVPTLSEARAQKLGAMLPNGGVVTLEGIRMLIAQHAPKRV